MTWNINPSKPSASVDTGKSSITAPVPASSVVVFETASDWDNSVSESGVVHESTTNTDHDDATIVKKGYSASSPFPSDLVGYWPLHEDSDSTAYDFSGNNNDLDINSTTTVNQTALLGTTGYDFDGSTDNAEFSGNPWPSSNPGVLGGSLWVYPHTTDGDAEDVMSMSKAFDLSWDDLTSQGFSVRIWGDNTGSIGPTGLSANTWHFVLFYWDVGNEIGLSVNGGAYNTYSSNDGLDNMDGPFRIGENSSSGNNFDGKLAEAKIYNDKPTSTEVGTLYDVVDTAGSLTTAWKSMDANATTLVTDSTIPTNTSIDVDVEQDTNNDGTADNTQTVSLSGGSSETNSLSGFTDTTGQYRVVIKPDQTDVVSASTLNSAEVQQ